MKKILTYTVSPKDEKYAENIRKFQDCPTIAISRAAEFSLFDSRESFKEEDIISGTKEIDVSIISKP